MLLRARPRFWLWGLIPLVLFGLVVVYASQTMIERDLGRRALEALKAEGIEWARPRFEGLSGTIEGEAPTEAERLKAIEIVKKVWGVRAVVDQLSLSPLISPFVWNAYKKDEKIILDGYVPNAKMQESILGLVKAKLPQAKLTDKMKVGRGVADENRWFGQVSFAFGKLALLDRGDVKLSDDDLSVDGVAPDIGAYEGLVAAFQEELPLQLKVKHLSILPPLVEAYEFLIKREGETVLLEGVVPDKAGRDGIVAFAKETLPSLSLEEKLTLGSGAPHGWVAAVKLSLELFAKLEEGSARLDGQDVLIEGTLGDEEAAKDLRLKARSAYPTGYNVKDNFEIKTAAAPVISPYETSLIDDGAVITLKGHVETEAQRSSLLDAVQAAFPDHSVVDELDLGEGAGASFLDSLITGVGLMKGVGNATLTRVDNELRLSGVVDNEERVNELAAQPDDLDADIVYKSDVKLSDAAQAALAAEKAASEEAAKKSEEEAEKAADEADVSEAPADAEKADEAEEGADHSADEAGDKDQAGKEETAEEESVPAPEEESDDAALSEETGDDALNPDDAVKTPEELAEKRKWLSPEETEQRLGNIHKEEGAVNAKECQLLMNSIVRGSAIRFGVNSSVINPDSYEILSKVTSVAGRCENTVIRIEGHTDSDGTAAYNLELSKRRARAVIAYLKQKGIPERRLDAKGFGEKRPVASNATGDGKALNRRIEFVVFEN